MSTDNRPGSSGHWQTTHWSVVMSARENVDRTVSESEENWRDSLELLCQSYWYPLYAYLRRKGYRAEDAQDLTQDFFASLIEKNVLQIVDPQRGRFRWFLMHAISQFASNWTAAQKAKKRGGDRKIFSLQFEDGENRYQHEPVDGWTAERLFDRGWALTLLNSALENVRQDYESSGKSRYFKALCVYVTPESSPPSYAEVAITLGLTETAIKVAIHRLREKYRNAIREQVVQTLEDPSALDEEIQQLMDSF